MPEQSAHLIIIIIIIIGIIIPLEHLIVIFSAAVNLFLKGRLAVKAGSGALLVAILNMMMMGLLVVRRGGRGEIIDNHLRGCTSEEKLRLFRPLSSLLLEV